ncbi:GFA family protein [Sulfitobacter geojensis]|uniref:GFA family protein n=1 Tax=Sulfitobacter geojensis TaxID=1342299 RepID=A0AAE2VYC6_9RHOB|nr:GFA family protein [Sulfitobacter geojensis]MBM1689760.1 GFA family protein [Sulfitobacter geojensis]MBM1693826.1 GFA family protein [Sulfitobacter geojensis]MBM1705992.1 GFA family protein [Sulfitobacter geojensis]MBM1710050.1 GFA family protein [Sulfitobacter geojensis]MBM1714116.1 GFA family protein [Sulfitobacter geojensis]
MIKGSCLCGGVTFELVGPLRNSVACHCVQCRKTSGHYVSATQVTAEQLHITKDDTLQWYQSSPEAARGFCNICGSSLFWRHDADNGATSVMSGTLDAPTGIATEKHIFVADKGDYYTIADGLPQQDQ